jgi:hypothetical protein
MRLQLITAVAVVLSTVGNQALAFGQSQPRKGSWDAVRAVALGSELLIRLKDGGSVKGRHVSSTDSELVVSNTKGSSQVQRDRVRKIYVVLPHDREDTAVKGAAFGSLFFLAGVGGVRDESGDGYAPGPAMLTLGIVGCLVGGAIGWLIGRDDKRILIYEA